MNAKWIYKIMSAEQWEQLRLEGRWTGAAVDLRDGFIHFSAGHQVTETLEKHFAGHDSLMLVGVPSCRVAESLKWEVSRGGQHFPHLFRELRLSDVGNWRKIAFRGEVRVVDEPIGGDLDDAPSWLAGVPLACHSPAIVPRLCYPLYLLHHGPGYVSLVDVHSSQEPQPQALALFSSYEKAADFVEQMGGLAGIKAIRNGKELQWLLTSLSEPVTDTVLDPAVDRPEIVGAWRRSVAELLESAIEIDNSPWNYPVYLLKSRDAQRGWSSIQAGTRSNWFSFLALFTGESLARGYQQAVEDEDGVCELVSIPDMWRLREHLLEMGTGIAGVAVNPQVEDGVRKCANCLEIGRLLEHYLVVVRPSESEM
ncbi:MAG: DUF952 domain-containing protein [Planctomycetaceae bacterium]|nr:DUF952 domain-containing protein [Planctomycetaceae bacterium]